ncbi:hypothetical protein [Bartonella queenslandensis]|uniref:hypothetical protein n=1 Tax=Bartonella queenslandensis TaxID=481138 RepID=UPI0005854098|nr:hypothetical protein [Bartonella queenslandensis]
MHVFMRELFDGEKHIFSFEKGKLKGRGNCDVEPRGLLLMERCGWSVLGFGSSWWGLQRDHCNGVGD